MRLGLFAAAAVACLAACSASIASAAPIPPVGPAAYPSPISLKVDATDLDHRIFKVRESLPAAPGPLTLFYPQWLPGNHGPTGPVDKLAGLEIRAGGKLIPWNRSSTNVYAFQVEVPPGVDRLELSFEYLSPLDPSQGRVVATPAMLNLQWNTVVLYPAGYRAANIEVQPEVTLPDGWKFGTALETDSAKDGVARFKPVSLETLVDSPMFAGRNFSRVELGEMDGAPVYLDIVADKPEQLEAKPEQIAAHRALVTQAGALFGGHHFNHYDFLFGLSETMSGIGLEHHRSSEDGTIASYFTEWDKNPAARSLLPHEFTHSWDGKFRRPADLSTPNYNEPMGDSLLWVYEGQTQYWGEVLTARSGLRSKEQALDALALTAAAYDYRVGRAWRSLQDTTNDPVALMRRSQGWRSWERAEDYYSEGLLVWLDADTLIRERTGGRRSLDDFARGFFGRDNGVWKVTPYSFDDVVAALNAVTPYDWAGFLRERLDGQTQGAPLDGVIRGGYRLVYTDTPSAYEKGLDAARKVADFTYSLGLVVGREGKLADVQWDGLAFKAGLAAGAQLIAVNGIAYSDDELKDAVKAAKGGGGPIELIVRSGDRFRAVRLDYHDGLRYPHLVRDPAKRARLDDILAPKD